MKPCKQYQHTYVAVPEKAGMRCRRCHQPIHRLAFALLPDGRMRDAYGRIPRP